MSGTDRRCDVCSAPAVSSSGACVFCRSPLQGQADVEEVLRYLAERLPAATVRRKGLFGRGSVRELTMSGPTSRFRARLKRGAYVFEPAVTLGQWIELLMVEVSRMAARDGDIRRRVSRSGWAFR